MKPGSRSSRDIVAAVCLAIGAVFGLSGTMVSHAPLRQAFWAIDGVGLVVASALLTMKYLRSGNDCVAAGFLVLRSGKVSSSRARRRGLQAAFRHSAAAWRCGPWRSC